MTALSAQSAVPHAPQIRFLGSGDAFGSGGRFQTCIAFSGGGQRVLIDCGASSLIAMKRFGVDPNSIAAVLLTHLHGDHFGGLPFFILDAQLYAKRTAPLLVGGPPGTPERLSAAMEALFPGSSHVRRAFEVRHVEWRPGPPVPAGPATVQAFPAVHASGAPPFSLRVEMAGRTVAYSGDTEWSAALPEVCRGADLFVCECLTAGKAVKFHLDYDTLRAHAEELKPKRMVLTHVGPEVLARRDTLAWETADDGQAIEL
ncbi:MAG: MBL fold metallo-hydrolase [SAR324 cluster bacterium]